jgi:hypothetical protein
LPYLCMHLHFFVYSQLNQILQVLCSKHSCLTIKIDTPHFLQPSDFTIIVWKKILTNTIGTQPQAETLQISSISIFWNWAASFFHLWYRTTIFLQLMSNVWVLELQICTTKLRISLKKPFKTCLHLSLLI